ncbi:ABC transporter ATP-binding protein/permease [Nocardioides sp. BSK12Z-4]|uniref:Fatty acid ABC transporter ATP-binding/permease protein n=2 Tax=Nocardioides bruguierae TaxID=2945102 RepID=A0A9X2IF64_9ACTN|nr:ABC transporter ATP-binding protein [Nocardioides bruguierae]MCM0620768.1 ABC transporter ATP-binding protein/permease [Nocardioides bruguierae]
MGPGGGMGMGGKAQSFGPSARRLLARLRPERTATLGVVVLVAVSVGLMSVGPRLLGHATDLVFRGFVGAMYPAGTPDSALPEAVQGQGVVPGQGVDFGAVGEWLLLVLGVYLVGSLFSWLAGFVLNGVVQRTIRTLRADVEEKLHRLPLSYVDRSARGEILSRVTNDIDNVSTTLQQTMSQLLQSLLMLLAVLAMMLWISPLLALVAFVSVPVSLALTRVIMKRSKTQFSAQWARTGELNAHVEEAFSGQALVKVFGRTKEVEQRFGELNDGLFDVSFRAQFISGLVMPTMMFVGNLNYVVVAVVGALRVSSGALTLGEVQAFVQYTRQFSQPLTTVASMANLLQSGVASAERVFELLDAQEQSAERTDETLPERDVTHGEVRFEHVRFSYEPDRELVRDLSLVARPGQTVAIVGPTGAGKTTLVNLVMRFYDLGSGRITLDGVDVAAVPRRDLRSRIGMVLQDTWLFEGTIRDNIAYGRPGATEEQVLEAARATFVDRFVHALPDGYDTVVTENGGSLSAGERQLVTIARAFLTDPALLILDEATSSVDTRTELLLQQAMTALRADRTSFVIAHRLSTIRDADLILVMEHGDIVEQGTHEELVAADGAYARLYRSQFEGAVTDGMTGAEGAAPVS